MFFLIRCVFWLTVVFCTIFGTDRTLVPAAGPESERQMPVLQPQRSAEANSADALSHRLQAWTSGLLQEFWSKTAGGCASQPAECVAIAARLSDFARQHPFKQARAEPRGENQVLPVETRALSRDSTSPGRIPMPPPRPPHLGRSVAATGRLAGSES